MKSFKLLLVIVAGTTTAALLYFGTGLHPIWPLLWFAPIPVIAIAPHLRASRAFALATVAWFFGATNLWKHLAYGIGLPWPLIVISFLIPAIVFALGVLFVRSFLRRGSFFLGAIAFPFYWVSYEFLGASLSPHSTYGNLAYTQMNCLPLIQIASLTGIWGISFAVFLFAGATGALLSGAGDQQQRRHGRHCNGSCPLCSLSFWRFAIAIESARAIARRHAHREGRADESLSRFRTAGVGTAARICR